MVVLLTPSNCAKSFGDKNSFLVGEVLLTKLDDLVCSHSVKIICFETVMALSLQPLEQYFVVLFGAINGLPHHSQIFWMLIIVCHFKIYVVIFCMKVSLSLVQFRNVSHEVP